MSYLQGLRVLIKGVHDLNDRQPMDPVIDVEILELPREIDRESLSRIVGTVLVPETKEQMTRRLNPVEDSPVKMTMSTLVEMDNGATAESSIVVAQTPGSQTPTQSELQRIRTAMNAALEAAAKAYNEWMQG